MKALLGPAAVAAFLRERDGFAHCSLQSARLVNPSDPAGRRLELELSWIDSLPLRNFTRVECRSVLAYSLHRNRRTSMDEPSGGVRIEGEVGNWTVILDPAIPSLNSAVDGMRGGSTVQCRELWFEDA